MHTKVWFESHKEIDHYEEREIRWDALNRIHLAQDMNQWWALVDIIVHLWVQLNAGKFLSS
jgi:hypothetical protein